MEMNLLPLLADMFIDLLEEKILYNKLAKKTLKTGLGMQMMCLSFGIEQKVDTF